MACPGTVTRWYEWILARWTVQISQTLRSSLRVPGNARVEGRGGESAMVFALSG
jgi:hypothetical protein